MSIAIVLTGVPRWMVEDDVMPPDMEEGVNEPHITLYYFGEPGESDRKYYSEEAQFVADTFGPPKFRVAGYGMLGTEGAVVLFLNAVDETTRLIRASFNSSFGIEDEGSQHYPWISHTTIGYDVSLEGLDSFIGAEFEATAIEVWEGDERNRYGFTGMP